MEDIFKWKTSQKCRKEPDILFAYIFGSYAKDIQHEKSDIDIAIYLKDEKLLEKDPLYSSRIEIKIERELAEKSLDQYFDFKLHIDRYDAARKVRLGT